MALEVSQGPLYMFPTRFRTRFGCRMIPKTPSASAGSTIEERLFFFPSPFLLSESQSHFGNFTSLDNTCIHTMYYGSVVFRSGEGN